MDTLNEEQLNAARDKYGLSSIRSGYLQFGSYTMPESFRHIREEIDKFEVYDDDVWVTSFPKCGTTWTQEIVWCMCNNFDYAAAESTDLDVRFPFLEFGGCFYTEDPTLLQYEPGFIHNSVRIAAASRRPRFIKTHLPWELLPRQIRAFERRPKIIHVARNPKDACVSFFHHSRLLEGFRGDFDLFWKLYISGRVNYSPMLQNVLSYWSKRSEGVLFLRYEDMKRDTGGAIKKISDFLDKPISDVQLQGLEHHVSFDVMKNNASTQHAPALEYLRKCGASVDQEGSFMRSGTSGTHKTLMNDFVGGVFDAWILKELQGTGLEL